MPSERIYKFRNPTSKESLIVILKDVAEKIQQDGFLSIDEIKEAFKDAENSLED